MILDTFYQQNMQATVRLSTSILIKHLLQQSKQYYTKVTESLDISKH